jgi:hypothetical protein
MNNELYLFNPFQIKKKSEIELKNIYEEVYKELLDECNTMYEYAHNIEVYSNLNYIIGEIVARLQRDVIELKTKIKIDTAICQTEERKKWNTEVDGKAPAISYFEALATRFSQDNINRLADKECSLMRFKNAYNSTEEKINALKKKMDAVKYEEFNQQ